jgi:hypothetical protein
MQARAYASFLVDKTHDPQYNNDKKQMAGFIIACIYYTTNHFFTQ